MAAVVLHWRNRADTERCVRSLLEGGGPERVLLLDNGSGEGAALLAAFAGDPRVEPASLSRNRGFAGGVNEGVRRAREGGASEILLLNGDAVLEPGTAALLREALGRDPGSAAAGPLILEDDGSGRAWFAGGRVAAAFGLAVHFGAGRDAADLPRGARPVGFLTFCAVLVRSAAWERVGPLDEEFFAYGEDADWCLRARAAGLSLVHEPAARARHRGGAAVGRRSPLQAYLLARSAVLLVRKRCGPLARYLVFWPWMLGVRGPHEALRALLLGRPAAAAAGLRGLLDGARGGAPRAFRGALGLDGVSA